VSCAIPDAAVARLVSDADPAVRAAARHDLLEDAADEDVLSSRLVRGLLTGLEDRDTLARPYGKWHGAHWRLVSLVELGIPAGYEPAVRATEAPTPWPMIRVRGERSPITSRCASNQT
jgi:hypothetical protein